MAVMSDVTQILSRIEQGDPTAAEHLLPLIYDELRKLASARMAHENADYSLHATSLVHEAYLRLVDVKQVQHWNSRGHFFSAAAEAMRRILVDRARDKRRLKRGGHMHRVDLDKIEIAVEMPDDDLLALDEAIQRLSNERQECAELVKLRFFGGQSFDEAARTLGVSSRTAKRHWAYARAWLFDALSHDEMCENS